MEAAISSVCAQAKEVLPRALRGARVAFVHDWVTGRRGGEKCLEALCWLFPDATLHTLLHVQGTAGPVIDAMHIRTSPLQRVPGIARVYRSLLPLMPLAARTWEVGEADLVVSFSHCVAKSVRVPPGVPHVCYCFTPMRYAWQGRAAYLDGRHGRPVRRWAAEWLLDRLRDWDRRTSAGVTRFVAISRTVQSRIAACYGRPSTIVYPPVDVEFYTPVGLRREDYFLVVSALVPYKRVDHAVEACVRLGRQLVVIGAGPDRARLEAKGGPNVRFLGWQSDEVVREHLRRCRALLFPGEEDFGIVPVEALACGAPVIALGAGGAAETVEEGLGWLYPDETSAGLCDAIRQWERAGCPHDPARGRIKAEQFSVQVYQARMLETLSAELLATRERGSSAPAPHISLDGARA